MSILRADVTSVVEEKGTLGGTTYIVSHPDWDNKPKAICFRPVKGIPKYGRKGTLCTKAAGFGTNHVGQGACRSHGGNNHANVPFNGDAAFKHGRRATMTQKHLEARVTEFMDKGLSELMTLTYELATARVIFKDLVGAFPDNTKHEDFGLYLSRLNALLANIGQLVDRMSRIQARAALTANEVLYIQATITDLFMKWVVDPDDRLAALNDLKSRMPGASMLGDGNDEDYIIDG